MTRTRGLQIAGATAVLFCTGVPLRAATVNFVMQTGNAQAEQGIGSFHGIFNNSATEIGQFANGGGTDGSAAFFLFTTNGASSGTYRGLQIGDEFTITNYRANNPGNFAGVAFNDSTNASSYSSDRLNNNRAEAVILGSGNFLAIGTTTNDSGLGAGADRTFKIKPTSGNTFNLTIGGTTYYDLVMKGSPAVTNRIRQFVLSLEEDNGNNSFWKGGALTDSGTIEIGGGNGTSTNTGIMDDGRAAYSATEVRTNSLIKLGTGTITLAMTNTFSGRTEIRSGTLVIQNDRSLGAVPASSTPTNLLFTNNLSAIVCSTNMTLSSNRRITLEGPAGSSYFWGVPSNITVMFLGPLDGGGHLVKNQDGRLVLDGKDATGNLYIDRGIVAASPSAASQFKGLVEIGTTGGDSAFAAELEVDGHITNSITVNGGDGRRVLTMTYNEHVNFGSPVVLNKELHLSHADDGVTMYGLISGTGTLVRSIGSGIVSLYRANTYSGGTLVTNGTLFANGFNGPSCGPGLTLVQQQGLIGGTGAVASLRIAAGGVLSPGYRFIPDFFGDSLAGGVGTLTAGDTTLDTNAVVFWHMKDFAGIAGHTNGWDRLTVTGTLDIAASVANPVTVRVFSVNSTDGFGFASNFVRTAGYTQIFATAHTITGFDTNKFVINSSIFYNAPPGGWKIALINSTNLALVYALTSSSMQWDTNTIFGSVQDGGGTWINGSGSNNWYTFSSGVNHEWLNAAGDTAIFGSLAGNLHTVSVHSSGITAGGVSFSGSARYEIAGPGLLTLTDGAVVTNNNSSSPTNIISAVVAVTGRLTSTGQKIKWANNGFTGGGTLAISHTSAFESNHTNVFKGLGNVEWLRGVLDLRAEGIFSGPTNAFTAIGSLTLSAYSNLTFNAPIATIGTNSTLTLAVSNAATFELAQPVTGSNALRVMLSGNLQTARLVSASTYAGDTLVASAVGLTNSAVVFAGGSDRMPTNRALNLAATAAGLRVAFGDASGPSHQNLSSLTASNAFPNLVGGNASASFLTLEFPAGNFPFTGKLGGEGANEANLAFTKSGAGTWILGASNAFAGATLIGEGALVISNGYGLGTAALGTLVSSGASLRVAASMTNGEPLTLAGHGAGNNATGALAFVSGSSTWNGIITNIGGRIMALAGSNTLAGGIVNAGGDLVLGGTAGSLTIAGSPVLLGGSSTLFVHGGTTFVSVAGNTMGMLNIAHGGRVVLNALNALPSSLALRMGDTNSVNATFDLNGNDQAVALLETMGTNTLRMTITNGNNTALSTFTVNQNVDTEYGGTIGGTLLFVKAGSGVLTLTNVNTFGGGTVVTGGTLRVGNPNTIPNGANRAGIAIWSTLDLNGVPLRFNAIIGNGVITNSSATAAAVNFNSSADTDSSTFPGRIVDGAGIVSLNKSGTGTFTLSGTNTYSGDTIVSNGTLTAGSSTALPSGAGKGDLNLKGTAGTPRLDLNGSDVTLNGLTGASFAVITNSSTATASLTVGADNDTSSYPGSIAGSAGLINLTKLGTGTFTLTTASGVANRFGGLTTVAGGRLILASANSNDTTLGGNVTVNSGAVLESQRTEQIPSNSLVTVDAGAFFLMGTNGEAIAAIAGGGTISNGSYLRLDMGTNASFSGSIEGGGALQIYARRPGSALFTQSLSGVSSYGGGTILSNTTLEVSMLADAGVPSSVGTGLVTLAGGTFRYVGGDTNVNRNITINLPSAIEVPGGTLGLSNKLVGIANPVLTKRGGGTLVVGGSADNVSLFMAVSNGTLILAKQSSANTAAVENITAVATGAVLQLAGSGGNQIRDSTTGVELTGGTFDLNGRSENIGHLRGHGFVHNTTSQLSVLTINLASGVSTSSAYISDGSGVVTLVKQGAQNFVLTGSNTYSGGTIISNGTLFANNGEGLATGVGTNQVLNTGILSGTGSVAATIFRAGGRISPGIVCGTLTVGDTLWNTSGVLRVETMDFAGTWGATNGWDRLAVTGALTIASATPSISIELVTRDASGVAGLASNFNDDVGFTQLVASAQSIAGFSVTNIIVNTSSFVNPFTCLWSVTNVGGTNLALVCTPHIGAPGSVSATADGPELIRLAARSTNTTAARDILVVHRLENPPSADPVPGTSYNVGDAIGGGTVLFKFTGSATVTNLEHVTAPGSTNFYRFYSIKTSSTNYSAPVQAGVTTEFYSVTEIIEDFAYTNGTALAAQSGGSGWGGAWTTSGGWTNITNATAANANFRPMNSYPTNRANIVKMSDAGNGGSRTAARGFTAVTNGKIYVSYLMAYDFSGTDKFIGVSLLSNGVERAFVGEIGGQDRVLGLDSYGAGSPAASGFNLNPLTGGTSANTGNTYLVIGRYNFATRELSTIAYYRTNAVPKVEPATWDITVTTAVGQVQSLDGIRLIAGSSDVGATIGNAWFDNVRIATRWSRTLALPEPYATNYTVGIGNVVLDSQMDTGGYHTVFHFVDSSGLTNDTTHPNVDLINNAGTVVLTNHTFTSLIRQNSGRTLVASNATMPAITNLNITLGIWTSRWTAVNSNDTTTLDSTTLSNGTVTSFTVNDDDSTGPTAPTQAVVVARGGTWTNTLSLLVQWSTNGATDASGISQWRVATNLPGSITDGTNAGSGTSFVWAVTAAHEGELTNLLFAVDADNDRLDDGMFGSAAAFTTRVDLTPPQLITNITASTNGVFNDTSQLRVNWAMATNAGDRADGAQLSPWRSYIIYYEASGSAPTTNSRSRSVFNGPADLGSNATTQIILSNLTYDTDHRIAVAGLDAAGNIGPLSLVVTQRTANFAVTQSLVAVGGGVRIQWGAISGQVYDVIYQDSTSWLGTLTNGWTLLVTVTNDHADDTGTVARTPPAQLTSTMRFYRVSETAAWPTNADPRIASREIYVARALRLMPGENWTALFFEPGSNTVAAVLGTNTLPSGGSVGSATRVSWYSATNTATATSVVWLATSGNWLYSVGGAGIANDKPLPLHEGFNIEIPGTATQSIVVVGRVTTATVTYVLGPGTFAAESYTLRARPIPHRVTLGQSGIKPALTGAPNKGTGPDEVRILDNTTGAGSKTLPRLRAWLNSTDNRFYDWSNPILLREGTLLEPGETIVIVRRNPGTTTVTNALPYPPPGKNINP